MKEIRLFDTTILNRDLFEILYKEILYKDNIWHFFFEGNFSVIRCKRRSVKKIKKYLKKVEIKYKIKNYEEDQEITKKYLDLFIPIFHSYSVMAMKFKEDELLTLFHRIVHCFLNPIGSIELIKKYGYDNCPGTWESRLLVDLAIQHAHSRGRIVERTLDIN